MKLGSFAETWVRQIFRVHTMVEQAVILCGGLGTRLGLRTKDTPKPLLKINGTPFLQILMQEVSRSGVRRFLLLAAHFSDQILEFARMAPDRLGIDVDIQVSKEPKLAGTGGALFHAGHLLEQQFYLLNGDSFLDFPLWKLDQKARKHPEALGVLALRQLQNADRYGVVTLQGDRISSFGEKAQVAGPALINGGVYLFNRDIIELADANCSLEIDVIPGAVKSQRLCGISVDGFFLDIGVEDAFTAAQSELTNYRRRPAVFLDRDGVLNVDKGHVGSVDRFEWLPGAREAIRMFNDLGYYVFVVTNQAGIAKQQYSVSAYWQLRDHIRAEVAAFGARIDDERFCPFHPDASDPAFRAISHWRKPGPGMIEDLLSKWPVVVDESFLIGDHQSDIDAATAGGLKGFLYHGREKLDSFALKCIYQMRGRK